MPQFGKSERFNEQVEFTLREAAELLTNRLGPGWGFTILGFNFGKKGDLFYISNSERKDVLNSMREFIQKNSV